MRVRILLSVPTAVALVAPPPPTRRSVRREATTLDTTDAINQKAAVVVPRFPREVTRTTETEANPVRGPYVDEEVVLGKVRMSFEEEQFRCKAYRSAGPRRAVVPIRRAAIVTCGGLCPGLNAVVFEVSRCLREQYGVHEVFGVEGGYAGLERGHLRPMREFEEAQRASPGTVLGTSRGRRCAATMAAQLRDRGIDALFVVGGDGTLRGAKKLCEADPALRLVAVPKTIDNDIPVVDRSFGFDTAVAAAKAAVDAAVVEATAFPRGLGLVRLMGRDAGFLAVHAALACPGTVDAVLIPEKGFDTAALLAYLDDKIQCNGQAVVVAAEGVNARLLDGNPDDTLDVGAYLCDQVAAYFDGEARPKISLKYVDPSYTVRALGPNPKDTILCSRLAAAAVHAAAAGYTDCAAATVHGHFALVPLDDLTARTSIVAVAGHLWADLVRSTGQPDFAPGDDLDCDLDLDGHFRESPSGGCVLSYDDDDISAPI